MPCPDSPEFLIRPIEKPPRRVVAWEMDVEHDLHFITETTKEAPLGFPHSAWSEPGFWRAHLHDEDREAALSLHEEALRTSGGWSLEYRLIQADGRPLWVREDVRVVQGSGRPRLAGFLMDVSAEKELEQRLRVQNQVTRLLAEAASLQEAAPGILETLARSAQWTWGSCWMVDESRMELHLQEWWHSPDFDPGPFLKASEQVRFTLGHGLPGRCWSQDEAIWLPDLSQAEDFPRKEAALRAGLLSGVAFPLRLGDRVLGVMAFFGQGVRPQESSFLTLLDTLSSQIGQFTERRRAEAALHASEARYRSALDQAKEGIFLVDLATGAFEETNRAFRRLLGWTEAGERRIHLEDVVAQEPHLVRADFARLSAAGHLHLGERQFHRQDGSRVDVEVDASLVSHEGREFAFCTVQDLTGRKRVEAEMARLVEILEATPDFVGIADPDGHAIYGNRAMQAIRGLDTHELARPIVDAHPAWAARILAEEAVPMAIREGVWRGETAFLDREGREIPTSQIIVSHRDPDGNLTFLSTIARDISVQKRQEQEMARLVKGLRDLHYAVDETTIYTVTNARGVITEVNDRFCQVSGFSREELLGQTHRLINSGHHSKAFFQEMWRTITTGRTWRGEICNRAKDGSLYWVDATIVPRLDAAGKPERYISLRWLITDRKHAEEALRHAQKLESLGLLAGGLAHDFNNLLAAILGNLSLSLLQTPPGTMTHGYLKRIETAVARATDLTRQMLAYSGKGTFLVKHMDLNDAVEEIARLLEASLPKKVQLEFRLHADLPGLEGDAAQIEQVILNLVTNAADAIGDREGHIVLTTGAQNMSVVDLNCLFPDQPLVPGPFVTLEVTDDGCGISPEVLDRIFDPFFTTKTQGRGLGLSAMLGILRGHGGGIKVYSEPGHGSAFRVYIPAASERKAAETTKPTPSSWTGSGVVLVADDDDMVRMATLMQLEFMGFQTLEARNGREAVERFHDRREDIALVLLDLSMPYMDGREALRAIRAEDPGALVILCSGFEAGATRHDPNDVQPSAFIQKPFRFEDLREVIQATLKQT